MNSSSILSVSQLNTYARSLLEGDINLRNVFVTGEISNFTKHSRSGHFYLTLKDAGASIKAVMFASNASRIKFLPENGMAVIVRGRVSLYERDGAYQLYIDDMQPEGIGSLAIAFEQLKEKLSKEGIFDVAHKKEIPSFPQKIGIISSPTGAAIQDVLNVLGRRYPLVQVVFAGVPVQGEGAGEIIAKAVSDFNYLNCVDVIIIARGGGSAEDLWEFNNESLAREIYKSKIPIISGVGHETDFTICDFAADLRAPTPSAAAELAVPNIADLIENVNSMYNRLFTLVTSKISLEEMRLDSLSDKGFLKKPSVFLDESEKNVLELTKQLNLNIERIIESKSNGVFMLLSKLDALSPTKVLSRGFSIVKSNDEIISSVKDVKLNSNIEIQMSDGKIFGNVTEIK